MFWGMINQYNKDWLSCFCLQVKAVVLDPSNEFNVDRTLTKEDVQKLIKVSNT